MIMGAFRTTIPAVSPTQRIGVGGGQTFGGFLDEHETSSALQGARRYETFANILANTEIVAAGTRYFLNLIAKPDWRADPSDPNNAAAVEVAEFVEDVMGDMSLPWHRVIRRAAMFRFHGFSIQEWTAKKRDDGRVGMLEVAARPQVTIERWINPDGDVLGVVQRSPVDGREIILPREKIVYMLDDALNDSPAGLGLFRHLVDANNRLQRFELLEAFSFEMDLRGIPIGRAPLAALANQVRDQTISKADATAATAAMRSFLAGHIKNPQLSMLFDSQPYTTGGENQAPSSVRQWDVELLQGSGTGAEPVGVAITRLQREMARVLGVEFLLLGDGAGSHALSRDKTHNFGLIVDSSMTELRKTFQKDFLEPLMMLNGIPEDLWPEFRTDAVQYRDVEQITKGLVDLATAGAVIDPTDPAIDVVRKLLGLPEQPEELVASLESLARAPEPEEKPDADDPDAMPDDDEGEGNER